MARISSASPTAGVPSGYRVTTKATIGGEQTIYESDGRVVRRIGASGISRGGRPYTRPKPKLQKIEKVKALSQREVAQLKAQGFEKKAIERIAQLGGVKKAFEKSRVTDSTFNFFQAAEQQRISKEAGEATAAINLAERTEASLSSEIESFNQEFGGKELTPQEVARAQAALKKIEALEKRYESNIKLATKEIADVETQTKKSETKLRRFAGTRESRRQLEQILGEPLDKPKVREQTLTRLTVGEPKGTKVERVTAADLRRKGLIGSSFGVLAEEYSPYDVSRPVEERALRVVPYFGLKALETAGRTGQALGAQVFGQSTPTRQFITPSGRVETVYGGKEQTRILQQAGQAFAGNPIYFTQGLIAETGKSAVRDPIGFGAEVLAFEAGGSVLFAGAKKLVGVSAKGAKSITPKVKSLFKTRPVPRRNVLKAYSADLFKEKVFKEFKGDAFYKGIYRQRALAKSGSEKLLTPQQELSKLYLRDVLPKVSRESSRVRLGKISDVEAASRLAKAYGFEPKSVTKGLAKAYRKESALKLQQQLRKQAISATKRPSEKLLTPQQELYKLYFKELPRVSKPKGIGKGLTDAQISSRLAKAYGFEPKSVTKGLAKAYRKESALKLQQQLRKQAIAQSKRKPKVSTQFVAPPKDFEIDLILKGVGKPKAKPKIKIKPKPKAKPKVKEPKIDIPKDLDIERILSGKPKPKAKPRTVTAKDLFKEIKVGKGDQVIRTKEGLLTIVKTKTKVKTPTKVRTPTLVKTKVKTKVKTPTKVITRQQVFSTLKLPSKQQVAFGSLVLFKFKTAEKVRTKTILKQREKIDFKFAAPPKIKISQKTITPPKLKETTLQAQAFATPVIPKVVTPTIPKTKIKEKTKLRTRIRTIKKQKTRFRKRKFDLEEGLTQTKQPTYFPLVKEKGKWIKASKQPTTKNRAWLQAQTIADNTTAKTISIKPSGKTTFIMDTPNPLPGKFRQKAKRSKITRNPVYIEKNRFAIDTIGEKQQLSAARYIKRSMMF